MKNELFEHFHEKMILYIMDVQCPDDGPSSSVASTPAVSPRTVDKLGEELVKCCEDLHLYDVGYP